MTNIEWIKSLSPEEMEEFLAAIYLNGHRDGLTHTNNFLWGVEWLGDEIS